MTWHYNSIVHRSDVMHLEKVQKMIGVLSANSGEELWVGSQLLQMEGVMQKATAGSNGVCISIFIQTDNAQ